MNIRQAMSFSELNIYRKPLLRQAVTALDITKKIFARAEEAGKPFRLTTEKEWQKDWLASEKFVLYDLPLNMVAVPYAIADSKTISMIQGAAPREMAPIVVDLNKQKVGQSSKGFYPAVVVVDGAHRHKATAMQGHETIRAWVGELAAAKLNLIHADHQFGASELQSKLQEQLREKFKPKDGPIGYNGIGPTPWIKECYPFENYFVYSYDGDLYKQKYKANQKKRSVVLVGEPEEVVEKYVGISASGIPSKTQMHVTPIEHAMQLHAAGSGTGAGASGPGTGAPGSSLGDGSGEPTKVPTMKSKKKKLKANAATSSSNTSGGGYTGYRSASKTQSDKTRGASKSDMFDKLKGSGYSGFTKATKTQSDKTRGADKSVMFDKLKGEAKVKKIITDYKAAVKAGYKASSKDMQAVAPPGLEHMVLGLKKHLGENNPSVFKIAWHHYNEGSKKRKK